MGVFTAVSRKREPSAGPCRYAPKLALWASETPPPDTNTKSTDESQCFLRGGRGWIRALSGRARLTAQAEGCQVVGRNLRPAQGLPACLPFESRIWGTEKADGLLPSASWCVRVSAVSRKRESFGRVSASPHANRA